MQRLVDAMQKDYLKQIEAVYAKDLNGDEFNAELNRTIAKLSDKWSQRFDHNAERLAWRFMRKVDQRTAAALAVQLKEISADYKARRTMDVSRVMQEAVTKNVSLIKTIPEQFHRRIEAMVTTSMSHQRDLHFLTKSIRESYDVSSRRAALIARDQANKITNEIAIQRSLSAGITRGIWQHIPGKYSSRKTHLAMDGKAFDLTEGMWDADEGKCVKPGELIACNCRYRAIIPGFE